MISSEGSVCNVCERFGDADLQASLAVAASRSAAHGGAAEATATFAPSSRRAGERLRIVHLHREGGRVYLDPDEELGREVALKETDPLIGSRIDTAQ